MYPEVMAARRTQIVVGLFLSLGVGLLPLGTWGRSTGLLGPLASGEILWWVAVAVLILYVLFIERRPLDSVGFRKFGIVSAVAGVIAGILLVAGIVAIYSFLF